jgi:hypothetical protein
LLSYPLHAARFSQPPNSQILVAKFTRHPCGGRRLQNAFIWGPLFFYEQRTMNDELLHFSIKHACIFHPKRKIPKNLLAPSTHYPIITYPFSACHGVAEGEDGSTQMCIFA